jgi:diguanylate cyclase (GGDEF)-like protein
VNTILEFASLRFDARAAVGPDGDMVDAVAAGVNYLGEELDASFREIERRVDERTAELAIATEQLAHRALHDQLTGLPNRALFWEHLSRRMALAGRRKTSFAILFLDVDGFKAVNDNLGHDAGDRLLVDLASRLQAAMRAGDTAARIGGDEFVVLLDEVAAKEAALAIAERLSGALREPYEIETKGRIVTTSIGVAVGPEGFESADEMVVAADTAMYDAKAGGGGRSVLYSETMRARRGRSPGELPHGVGRTGDAGQAPRK